MNSTIAIVGAGHSGSRVAYTLRKSGFVGEIHLLGNEGVLPYDRPPLSKSVLLGEKTVDQCKLYEASFYSDAAIQIDINANVLAIDRPNKQLLIKDGRTVNYDRLLLATGAEPRRLSIPGSDTLSLYYLRTVFDAVRIRQTLQANRHLVIVGAGFLGLEIAASAIQKGCQVDVIEFAPRALTRAVPSEIADQLVDIHRCAGVKFHFSTQVLKLENVKHRTNLLLSNGSSLECEAVIVGIGVAPRVDLAQAAGLVVDNGIAVASNLQTSDPDIFAIGDACSFHSELFGRRLRLESWKNADEQARIVTRNLMGFSDQYIEVPWFWSKQFNTTLQVSGLPSLGKTAVHRKQQNSELHFALDETGTLVAVSGIGLMNEIAPEVRLAQTLIARKAIIDPTLLENPGIGLKSIVASGND